MTNRTRLLVLMLLLLGSNLFEISRLGSIRFVEAERGFLADVFGRLFESAI